MSSYATVEDGTTYLADRLFAGAWDSATDADKTKALAHATKIIDTLRYKGSKAETDQLNEFPRDDDTEVPTPIVEASIEIALALLDGIDPEKEYEQLRLGSQSYGAVKSTYRENNITHIVAGVPSITAWRLMLPYLDLNFEVTLHRVD